ncbi:hypothetical protein EON64_06140 [archaeon]|nr:MAG: hypothetical protein EON64_06140 [archaeon]
MPVLEAHIVQLLLLLQFLVLLEDTTDLQARIRWLTAFIHPLDFMRSLTQLHPMDCALQVSIAPFRRQGRKKFLVLIAHTYQSTVVHR